MKHHAVCLLAIVSASPAQAVNPQACAAIPADRIRLQCFDRAFPRVPETESREDIETRSRWIIREKSSPVDDSPGVLAYLDPESVTSTYVAKAKATLVVVCQEGNTKAYFLTSMLLGPDPVEVTTRVNKEPAEISSWSVSTDRRAAGLWGGDDAITFLKAMNDGDQMFVRIRDGDVTSATYDLTGIDAVKSATSFACQWP
ncbi:type VI secretion system-associated protein TagO [uncultured Nitratireductor sp.]|uniref:type VI secretion system-associated protein TagO n=1 Tax=uncultured Nitratireductor sp. TaxID=520953 RepID=UPI00260E5BFE|nr:type VI secretion system-associated protein TagO [uncultured Nitratireductor sp.]